MALVLFAVGCRRPAATAARPAYLVVTADTAGWIVPCGCTANQSGGLLRRGTYLAGLRRSADVLYADAGGAPAGTSAYQLAKFQFVLDGEAALGIAVHNLGRGEVALGPAALRAAAAASGVRFISPKARAAADGKPIADAARIVTLAGRRIALVGVCSPRYATADVSLDDPRSAIEAAAAAQRGQFDALVVLAYLPEGELAALADAVIGGPTGQPIVPRLLGPTLLAAATSKGKFAVRLSMPASGAWAGQVDELGPSYGDDPAQASNLHAFLAAMRARDLPAADTGLAPATPASAPADYRIAGSASCLSCHADSATVWHASHHANAWATLVAKGSEVDPSCQQCHTTGYGLPGGFDRRSAPGAAAVEGVGCESCHGPSLAHVRDVHVRTPYNGYDQCVRCHDHENSPAFDLTAYWPRVRHGKGQVPPPTTGVSP
jgi:hypothetical protein